MTDWVLRYVCRIPRKISLMLEEQGLSSFFAKFSVILDDFLKFQSAFGTIHFRKIIKYAPAPQMENNEKKPCTTCLLTHFSMALSKPETQISGT